MATCQKNYIYQQQLRRRGILTECPQKVQNYKTQLFLCFEFQVTFCSFNFIAQCDFTVTSSRLFCIVVFVCVQGLQATIRREGDPPDWPFASFDV